MAGQNFVSPYLLSTLGAESDASVAGKVRKAAAVAVATEASAPVGLAEQQQLRRRRESAPRRVHRGYRDEFLYAEPEFAVASDAALAASVSNQGTGSLGSAGTPAARRAAGLTRLTGDGFGGGVCAPMLPGSWQAGAD